MYVKPDERTQPNPFLSHLPTRDVETTDGVKLTLMNPAFIMSQMTSEFESNFGIKGKITGQVLINPANKADPWELKSLKQFDQGVEEILEKADIYGQPYLRFMRPMVMEEGCVSCHGHLGFKVGDIRGGVSVSVPLSPYYAAAQASKTSLLLTHGIGWLVGILIIGFAALLGQRQAVQKRRADEAIQESELRFRTIADFTYGWEYWIGAEGDLLYISPSCERISGYAPEHFQDSPENLSRIVVTEDRSLWDQHSHDHGKALALREIQFRIQRPDGEVRWIEHACQPVLDDVGQFRGYRASNRDITERKRDEDWLRKLAQAVEQSSDSIFITNFDGEIEYVNQSFVSNTGYSRDEVIDQNLRILLSSHSSRESYDDLWDTLGRGKPWKGELYNMRKDGSDYTELASISPLRQSDGRITHYVAVNEDITEKKKLASELDQHREHLEELVTKRTIQLAELQEQAEAANKTKSAFLANMSHEIRTPMNAIIGFTHLMKRAGSTPKQTEHLDKIDAAAGHLLSIINDILDISKIEAGKLVLEQSDFHLASIFEHVTSLLKDQAGAREVTIKVDMEDESIWLRGDSTRLRQALLNYASNAIKFTERGVITLRARIQEEFDDTLLLRFEVQDTGIGIAADKMSDLFGAFEQADASTTRKYGGSGLGLSITRHLAQLMGGEVGVESELDKGSTFWFTVRLGRGCSHELAPHSTAIVDAEGILRSQHKGSYILLVEDNAINREVAYELLAGSLGMNVDLAENGRVAIDMVRNTDYDLILMDIQMPEMDGLEATRLIRIMEHRTELPVLAMTANIFDEDRRACLAAGMNDFVAKPIDPENFFLALIKWLPGNSEDGESQDTQP